MRDAVDARGLEQAAQREISKGLTACQVAVARDNEILWTASFGSAAAETKGRVDYAAKIEAGEPGGGGVMTAGPEWGARSASRSRRRASPSLSSRWAMGDSDQLSQFVRGIQMSNLALELGR